MNLLTCYTDMKGKVMLSLVSHGKRGIIFLLVGLEVIYQLSCACSTLELCLWPC